MLLLLSSGCFRHDYFVSGTTPEPNAHSEWRHGLIYGVVSLSSDTDLRQLCPQGISRVENQMDVFNVVFFLLTAGLYASTTADVYCQAVDAPVAAPAGAAPPAPPVDPAAGVPIVEDTSTAPGTAPAPPPPGGEIQTEF